VRHAKVSQRYAVGFELDQSHARKQTLELLDVCPTRSSASNGSALEAEDRWQHEFNKTSTVGPGKKLEIRKA
jgi:hypothetical protein